MFIHNFIERDVICRVLVKLKMKISFLGLKITCPLTGSSQVIFMLFRFSCCACCDGRKKMRRRRLHRLMVDMQGCCWNGFHMDWPHQHNLTCISIYYVSLSLLALECIDRMNIWNYILFDMRLIYIHIIYIPENNDFYDCLSWNT